MANRSSRSEKQVNLSPAAFSILLALSDGEKHGYAILRAVSDRTDGAVRLLPGTLYNLLKRMLADGWIEELDERPDPDLDDQRRRYYRLSAIGQKIAGDEAARMAVLVRAARQTGLVSPEQTG